ncbi:MAG TPA: hypothetical protein PLK37_10535 [Terricaulis sp.]|nr:hypothetical protein [Terricaulis sp.]
MVRLALGAAALLAAIWIASYATGRGALVSSRHLMTSEAYAVVFDPTATDEPVGHVCEYLRYDGWRRQYLVDQNVWADRSSAARALLDARPIDNWANTSCPIFSEGLR